MTTRGPQPHILILVYYFPPFESAGYSIRTVKWIKYLARQGWNFSIITSDPNKPLVPQSTDSSRYLLDDLPENIDLIRIPAPLTFPKEKQLSDRPSPDQENPGSVCRKKILSVLRPLVKGFRLEDVLVPDLHLLWCLQARSKAVEVGQKKSVDLVFATCPPFSISWLGRQVAQKLCRPLVLDFRDDWVDTPFFFRRPTWLHAFHRRAERKAISFAKRVISVTESSHQRYLKRYPDFESKFHFIPNGYDSEDFGLRHHVREPNQKFTIVGVGGFARNKRSPETFYQAIGQLAQRREDVARLLQVRFYGHTHRRDFTREELTRWGVTNLIEERDPLTKIEFLSTLRQADLLLAILLDLWTETVPGKLYEYWAAGWAPILLLGQHSPAHTLINRYQLGMAIHREDIRGIEHYIEHAFDAWKREEPLRVSTQHIQQFDRRSIANRIGEVLVTAIKGSEIK